MNVRRVGGIAQLQSASSSKHSRQFLMESPDFNRHHHRNIPDETVIEILSRLPIESLLRFKCVSKVWRSLISDPKFTLSSSKSHLQIAFSFGDLYSVNAGEAWSNHVLPKNMFLYDDKKTNAACPYWGRILGSCNGLLLVSLYAVLYLWNPTTRQSTKLLSIQTDVSYCIHLIAESGLCYDSYSDDYKAVMVDRGLVTVVSFRRKYWATKTCSFFANGDGGENLYSGPVVNEKLHWVITCFANGEIYPPTVDRIVYFDPLTDEFVELPMPLVPNNGKHKSVIQLILGLGVLDGCLCMARCVCERGDEVQYDYMWEDSAFNNDLRINFTELLVMKEHGVGESWTSAFIMSNNVGHRYAYGSLVPLCFIKNGEVLFLVNKIKLLAYNPDEMSQREISCHMSHSGLYEALYMSHSGLYEALYIESLASPAAYGQEEDWIVKEHEAFHLLDCMSRSDIWSCCGDSDRDNWSYFGDSDRDTWSYYGDSNRGFLNFSEEDNSIDEDDVWVVAGFLEKENNKEKFVKKEKAWRYFLSATEKKQKLQQRIKAKRKITRVRKNQQKMKQGQNIEVEYLHKKVLDFSVR